MKIGDSVFVSIKYDDLASEDFRGTVIAKSHNPNCWVVKDQDDIPWEAEESQIELINDENLDFK